MPHRWIEPEDIIIPKNYSDSVGGNPLVSHTLYLRGLRDLDSIKGFLDPGLYQPASCWELPDMAHAVEILNQAIKTGKHICVWGDFDVDGQTSTTLLVSVLRDLGGNTIYHIPVRARESHGIDPAVLMDFLDQGIDLLLTCDTGIAANPAIQLARKNNVDVIVTDHHDLPDTLPPAQALINPKRLPANHPLSTLPGVGVAYKLAEALFENYQNREPPTRLLDLVALGIIADLVYLQGDTRYLVQQGLPILRQMNRLGLQILSGLADLNPHNLTEDHISFVLAPRLNALGRLGDANSIVEFFTTTDNIRAQTLAYELEGLNANRRLMSEQVYRSALSQLESDRTLEHFNAIILANPAWPAGVIGIVAARLAEQFLKPVILFSSPSGQIARGSARSIQGINISSMIASQKELLEGYGGHPMAAGLSIRPDNISEFRRNISRVIADEAKSRPPENTLNIDAFINLKELSLELIADIERLAPFGMGNPPLTLACRNLSITGYSAVGKHGEHLLISVEDELGYSQQAVWWQGADQSIPDFPIDLAFTARASTYRGQKEVQLEWIDFRPASSSLKPIISTILPILVEDHRNESAPMEALKHLQIKDDIQIWCETEQRDRLQACDRLTIEPCTHLVIWSPPAGQTILRQILEKSSPQYIYLFANPTNLDKEEIFLKRLVGLCKFAIRVHEGNIHLAKIAAATNQPEVTVLTGLQWLQNHGFIKIIEQENNTLRLCPGTEEINPNHSTENELHALLEESAAYRNYYSRADKDRLIAESSNPIPKKNSLI